MTPYIHPLLSVKRSPVHGWGVFAEQDIPSGTVIERSAIVTLPSTPSDLLWDYRFGWPQNKPWTEMVMAMGWAGFYNHSSSSNVEWESDEENRLLVFITTRDVEAGEELFTYYGDVYDWNSVRYIKETSHDGSISTIDTQIHAQEKEAGDSRQDEIFEI